MPFLSSVRGSYGGQGRTVQSVLRLNWYDEGNDCRATIANWNDQQVYNMTTLAEFGNCWVHGWGGSARTYILTVNNLPFHNELRFSANIHMVDSWDNEATNTVRVNNSDGSERLLASFTHIYNVAGVSNLVVSNGATVTQNFPKTYSYRPWGNGAQGGDGYINVNSNWYPHTRSQFQAWFYTPLDQPASDEAYYIHAVKFDLR